MTNKYAYLLVGSMLISSFVSTAQKDIINHTHTSQEDTNNQTKDSCIVSTDPEIYGTLRNYDAELLTDASITLLSEAGDTLQNYKTDDAGYFAFPFKEIEKYKIVVEKEGYRPMTLSVDLKNNESVNLQTLVLRRDSK